MIFNIIFNSLTKKFDRVYWYLFFLNLNDPCLSLKIIKRSNFDPKNIMLKLIMRFKIQHIYTRIEIKLYHEYIGILYSLIMFERNFNASNDISDNAIVVRNSDAVEWRMRLRLITMILRMFPMVPNISRTRRLISPKSHGRFVDELVDNTLLKLLFIETVLLIYVRSWVHFLNN